MSVGGRGRVDDSLDPMDPAAYSDVPRYVCIMLRYVYTLAVMLYLMGLNEGQSTKLTCSDKMHWTSGVCERSLAFDGLIEQPLLYSVVKSKCLYCLIVCFV